MSREVRGARNVLIISAIAALAGAYAYNRLLTPEAKQHVGDMLQSVQDALQTVRQQGEDMVGTYMEEDLVTANKQKTEEAWTTLGY